MLQVLELRNNKLTTPVGLRHMPNLTELYLVSFCNIISMVIYLGGKPVDIIKRVRRSSKAVEIGCQGKLGRWEE